MKGFIYKIYDNTNGNVYYGSTSQRVSQRITNHRSSYKLYCNGQKTAYCKSFDILCNNDYTYSVIEEGKYDNRYELYNRERYYIENFNCINKFIPNQTKKEYKEKKYKKTEETIKKDNKRRAVKYYNDKYPFLNIDKDISDDKFQEIKDNIWNIKKVIKLLKFFKDLDLNEEKYNEYLQNLIE